jgi:polysaccharide export outer membrane protein
MRFHVLPLVLAVWCAGCQNGGTIPKGLAGQSAGALAPGDVVRFSFPGTPELNQAQKVRADGKITAPLVGEFQAGGKRLGDLQEELSGRLKSQLKNTEVVVTLESSAIPVYVTGAVNRPGKIVLERPMTVLEAIMEAGGGSNLANLKKVVVIRNAQGRHYTQTFDLSPSFKGRSASAFYLRPYDMIHIPERFF